MDVLASVLLILTFFAIFASHTLATLPEFTLNYEDGTDITTNVGMPSLPEVAPVDYCDIGAWVEHKGEGYTGSASVFSAYKEQQCYPAPEPFRRSIRPAGDLSDFNIPSATFYADFAWSGDQNVLIASSPEIDFISYEFISLTTDVELFLEPNYEGQSYCYPSTHDWCYEGFCSFLPAWDLPNEYLLIKSVRLGGCSSTATVLKGRDHPGVSREITEGGVLVKHYVP